MGEPFIGSEAVACGDVARSALRTQYTRVFHDVYVSAGTDMTPQLRARAGWLWSRRRGIIAGMTAAALHGAATVNVAAPVDIIHNNRNTLTGLRVRGDRIGDDEVEEIGGIPTTIPARTALDLACWYPTSEAVATIDALAQATDLQLGEVEALAARYPGRRSIRWARGALALVDAGARSPRETWLRLQLVKAGLPTPQTQLPVRDEFGAVITRLDMGWPELKVAVEYGEDRTSGDPWQHARVVRRLEMLERRGWIVVQVLDGSHPAETLRRVRAALTHRVSRQRGTRRGASR